LKQSQDITFDHILTVILVSRQMMLYFVDEFPCFSLTFFHCESALVITSDFYYRSFDPSFISLILVVSSPFPCADFCFWFHSSMLSAVNIKRVFDTSNEMKYEKDAPHGMDTNYVILFFISLVVLFLFCPYLSK
jgi:hypothetical protein